MRQVVCNYAPIRFLPYRELGEFVTVGVVLHCPQTDFFGYRLVSLRKTGRVTGFFPELDNQIFKASIIGVTRELERVQGNYGSTMGQVITMDLVQRQMRRFQELIRRREGLLHFGDPGTRLVQDPKIALGELFDHYVNRQFAQKKEYQETVMRQQLARFLKNWNLSDHYHQNEQVGDDDFHLNMPFVHRSADKIIKIIKPLDLNKKEPTDVYQHGGTWVKNMERLKKRGWMPKDTVFTVQFPPIGKTLDAAMKICEELGEIGIVAIDFGDTQKIRQAAEVA